MKRSDFIGPSCDCVPCRQAGVNGREIVRDYHTGYWLHGYDLKRWYDARERFRQQARAAVGARGRHAAGLEKLVLREPGEDG